jgi:prevent-host-death family protein
VNPAPRDYNLLMLATSRKRRKLSLPGTWKLQDAKARLGEVVRQAQTEGPQRLTVHGKEAAVVLSASDYAKAAPPKTKGLTGAVLVEVMQEARRLGLKIKPLRDYPKMRAPLKFD